MSFPGFNLSVISIYALWKPQSKFNIDFKFDELVNDFINTRGDVKEVYLDLTQLNTDGHKMHCSWTSAIALIVINMFKIVLTMYGVMIILRYYKKVIN
jgi:hypothetical protein